MSERQFTNLPRDITGIQAIRSILEIITETFQLFLVINITLNWKEVICLSERRKISSGRTGSDKPRWNNTS